MLEMPARLRERRVWWDNLLSKFTLKRELNPLGKLRENQQIILIAVHAEVEFCRLDRQFAMSRAKKLLGVAFITGLCAVAALAKSQKGPDRVSPSTAVAVSPACLPSGELPAPRETYRGFYVDLAAAVFGWLAVAFALITVGFTIVGIREFRDVKRKIEQDLRAAIQTQLTDKIKELTEQTIQPQIQRVLELELRKKLDTAVQQFDAEVAKSLQDKDVSARLTAAVVDEVVARLSKPQAPRVSPEEFEPK